MTFMKNMRKNIDKYLSFIQIYAMAQKEDRKTLEKEVLKEGDILSFAMLDYVSNLCQENKTTHEVISKIDEPYIDFLLKGIKFFKISQTEKWLNIFNQFKIKHNAIYDFILEQKIVSHHLVFTEEEDIYFNPNATDDDIILTSVHAKKYHRFSAPQVIFNETRLNLNGNGLSIVYSKESPLQKKLIDSHLDNRSGVYSDDYENEIFNYVYLIDYISDENFQYIIENTNLPKINQKMIFSRYVDIVLKSEKLSTVKKNLLKDCIKKINDKEEPDNVVLDFEDDDCEVIVTPEETSKLKNLVNLDKIVDNTSFLKKEAQSAVMTQDLMNSMTQEMENEDYYILFGVQEYILDNPEAAIVSMGDKKFNDLFTHEVLKHDLNAKLINCIKSYHQEKVSKEELIAQFVECLRDQSEEGQRLRDFTLYFMITKVMNLNLDLENLHIHAIQDEEAPLEVGTFFYSLLGNNLDVIKQSNEEIKEFLKPPVNLNYADHGQGMSCKEFLGNGDLTEEKMKKHALGFIVQDGIDELTIMSEKYVKNEITSNQWLKALDNFLIEHYQEKAKEEIIHLQSFIKNLVEINSDFYKGITTHQKFNQSIKTWKKSVDGKTLGFKKALLNEFLLYLKEVSQINEDVVKYSKNFFWADSEQMKKINATEPEEKALVLKVLKNISKPKLELTPDKLIQIEVLKKEMPNFSEVIDYIVSQLKLNLIHKAKMPFKPIVLLGDPGLGKTYVAKQLATILDTGFEFIDFASTSASFIIKGGTKQWKDAEEGKILKTMIHSKTINPIVLYDEIDKNSSNKNYPPEVVLYQLFEPMNSTNFEDEYLGIRFDASTIINICTANNIQHMSEPLLSRMKVFTIEKLKPEQTRYLAQKMYEKTISNYSIFNPKLGEEILETLEVLTPREIDTILNEVIAKNIQDIPLEEIYKYNCLNSIELKLMGTNMKKKDTSWGFE